MTPELISTQDSSPSSTQTSNSPETAAAATLQDAPAAGVGPAQGIFGSKGVDYYAYLDPTMPFAGQVSKPINKAASTQTFPLTPGSMQHGNLQIEDSDVPWLDNGRFSWQVQLGAPIVASGYAEISPFSGNLGDSSMGNMLGTPSQFDFNQGWAVSYGFYDADSSKAGVLTNQDQFYAYATRDLSTWMSNLYKESGGNLDFQTLVLPGAHDAGMFDPTMLTTVAGSAAFLGLLGGALGFAVSALATPMVIRGAINFAFTQKDNVTSMLNLGIRYFDFRPGYCCAGIASGSLTTTLYHQHLFVPGYPYQSFLVDVLNWLKAHPTEIVVINLNHQGFASDSMIPTLDVLNQVLSDAQAATGTQQSIVPGSYGDINLYREMLGANKRLIFLNQFGYPSDTVKWDSYSDDLYKTTDVNNILTALKNMNPLNKPAQSCYTVLQVQGTATGASFLGNASKAFTLSDTSSPLMSTKPGFDNQTYPWLVDNLATIAPVANELIVILNDFADNALTNLVVGLNESRLRLG
jgi:hypothetical protein